MNIKNYGGKQVLSKDGKAESWKEFIEGFYKGNELPDNIVGKKVDGDDIADTVLREQFDRALQDLSWNQGPGVDDIPSELLKFLGESAMTKQFHLVRKMYESGEMTSDFKNVIINLIPKKGAKIVEPSV